MEGIVILLWLAGIVVTIVLIVAQCQLFAIRRLLETLVKQGSSVPSAEISPVTADGTGPVGDEEPAREVYPAPTKEMDGVLIFVLCVVVGVLLLVFLLPAIFSH
jgi:hypothetical protein